MVNTTTSRFPNDLGKWLAVAGLLVSLGVLPKTWQKGLSTATVLYWLSKKW